MASLGQAATSAVAHSPAQRGPPRIAPLTPPPFIAPIAAPAAIVRAGPMAAVAAAITANWVSCSVRA